MEFLGAQDNNMANITQYPDTIIFDPVTSGYYDTEDTLSSQGSGRLMNRNGHIDGLHIATADEMKPSSANLVLTRNGKGDWSLNRTAAGAETYYVRCPISSLLRTGENYVYGDFSAAANQTSGPPAGNKGLKPLSIFVTMNVGVASLTSATLRLSTDVYPVSGAAAAAVVCTDIVAATALTTLTAQAANAYLTQQIAVPTASQAFLITDCSIGEIELVLVMANTGTVQIAQIGMHCEENYT
jgi:hypothetical protein